jgi:alkylation response protein AidB-like acyl-CoA dehydrogenase
MTERKGGSDVSDGTETIAVLQPESSDLHYKLYGYKWFSSATDSDMTITLARVVGKDNKVLGLILSYINLIVFT